LSSQTSHLEGADPELAISFLRRGTTNLTSLKPRLVSCSDEWIGSFLDQGGLELLFECLTNLGEKRFANFSNAIDQLTCIGCIKAVMNSKVGLEHIVESQSYVRTLAEGKQTDVPFSVSSELVLEYFLSLLVVFWHAIRGIFPQSGSLYYITLV
jgi:hypothetical protein